MEKRKFGKTGEELSVIGFGGIIVGKASDTEACRFVASAIDRGINYFDVAPAYWDAELRMGPALKPYRNDVFLACKTLLRSADQAAAELHNSLKLLKTDHFDLYLLHCISSMEDVEQVLAPGGALEAVLKAKQQGLVRYIGFSAHCETAAMRLLDEFDFDCMMLPINRLCWQDGNFGPAAVEKAQLRGAAILAIKALAKRPWRKDEDRKWPNCWYCTADTLAQAKAALAFTLAKPVTLALSPGYAELLELTCDALDALGDQTQRANYAADSHSDSHGDFQGEPIFPIK